jgi:6-pyruvoyl-tetrahydropterin synthase
MKGEKLDIFLEKIKAELIELLNSFEETILNSQVEDDWSSFDCEQKGYKVIYNEKDSVLPLITITENYSEIFIENVKDIIEEIEED